MNDLALFKFKEHRLEGHDRYVGGNVELPFDRYTTYDSGKTLHEMGWWGDGKFYMDQCED